MAVKVAMRLEGLDLREVESYLRIPEELGELGFQAKGPLSYAVVYSDSGDAAYEAADWARKIAKLMPGVRVVEVYDELLNGAQIAARCGVAPEAVRLWAAGKRRASVRPFPAPREVVEQGRTGKLAPLFAWSEVLAWVRDVLGEDPEEGAEYLSHRQVADLDAELAHLESAPAGAPVEANQCWTGWHSMLKATRHVTSPVASVEVSACTSRDTVALMLEGLDDVLVANRLATAPARRLTTR